uniref:Capsid protein n=1 Tax=Rodent Torque teno virus 3 TaxID=2054610 RepID=A0A8F0K6J5_9VIRU|nr:ORF1 [Rodent Torque teno virus 3]
MAYFYRRRYYRPRRSYYRRRTYRPRRSYYRRRRTRWPVRRRRKLAKRARKVVQWQPRNVTKCLILGYMPLINTARAMDTVADTLMPKGRAIVNWEGGGVDSGHFTLLDLYWEEMFFRARWTKSNQGFNLARYFGVEIKLYRYVEYSYIFWYSVDDEMDDTEPMHVAHPSQMLLYKNKVIVKRTQERDRKTIRLRIKPPSKLFDSWRSFKDLAQVPLIKWRCTIIEFDMPWTAFINGQVGYTFNVFAWSSASSGIEKNILYFPWQDDGTNTKICLNHVLQYNQQLNGPINPTDVTNFWPTAMEYSPANMPLWLLGFGYNQEWYDMSYTKRRPRPPESTEQRKLGYWAYVQFNGNPAFKDASTGEIPRWDTQKATCFIKWTTLGNIASMAAPFTPKKAPRTGLSVTMGYKFYFQWGGTPGCRQPPVPPEGGGRPSAYTKWGSLRSDIVDPTQADEEVLTEGDFDSDGDIITDQALARLTKPSIPITGKRYKRKRMWGYHPKEKEYKKRRLSPEPDSSDIEEASAETADSETEEAETSSKRMGHRDRVRRLLRILQQLGIRRPLMVDRSGKKGSLGSLSI